MLVGRSARSVRLVSALVATLALVLSGLVITSPTAAAAGCTSMTDADLAFDAPDHSSDLESDPLCLELDEAPGTVVQVYMHSSVSDGVAVSVTDGGGTILCAAQNRETVDCRLSGTGPFRVQAEHTTWGPWGYEVAVRRITDPVGCSTLGASAFGDPGEEMTTMSPEVGRGDCRVLDLPASPVIVNETGRTAWTLYDEDGSKICSRQNPMCEVTSSGRKVLVHPFLPSGESTFTTAVVPLTSGTDGCGPEMSTSWSEPATTLTLSSLVQVDCSPLDASPGDRVLGRSSQRFGGSSEFVVLDDAGNEVCERSEGYGGCVLDATGPYRIVSYPVAATSWDHYTVSARNLTTLEGCPTIAVAEFGTEPEDHHPGASCRQFEVTSSGRYLVGTRKQTRLFTADGREVPCESNGSVCALEPGRHVLMTPQEDTDFVTPLHDLTDESGCREGADTLSTRLTGTTLEDGFGCYVLPSPPGSTVTAVRPLGIASPRLRYFDATGEELCTGYISSYVLNRCGLEGEAPFRALVVPGGGDYRFAFTRLDDPQGCTELAPGDFDTLEGVDLTLDADVFARCLVVPESDFTGQELFAFDRRAGSEPARLAVRDTASRTTSTSCLGDVGPRGVVRCGPNRGGPSPNGHTVLLLGTGQSSSSYRVVRRQLGSKASCKPVASTRIGGPATSGTTRDFLGLDCYTVEADPGDTIHVNLHTSTTAGHGAISAYDADGHWECSGPEQCWLDGKSQYQVIVANRDAEPAAGDYGLQSMLVKSASELPLDECIEYDDYSSGFGPLEATLDSEFASTCVTMRDDGYDSYGFEVQNTAGGDALPFHLRETMGPWFHRSGRCEGPADAFECSGFAGVVDEQYYDRGMLVLYRSDGPDEQPFRLTAFCASGSDCGDIFRVTGASPMTAPAETRTTVTIHGGRLYQGLDYKLVRDGHEDVVGTPVAGDVHDREVEFDLTGVEPGDWRLKVVSTAYGTQPAGTFVVTQPHLESTEPPEIRGDMRVDDRVRAYEGAWSAEPDSFTYQWQVNGRNIDWATYPSLRLRPWMRDDLVTVTVTAHKDGYVDASATSIWRRVYPAWPPQNNVRPRVKGIKHVGHWVRATHGTWSPKPRRFLYRWYLDGRRLKHQNHRRLFLRRWMRGDRIRVKVLARRPGYLQGSAWSRRWLVRR